MQVFLLAVRYRYNTPDSKSVNSLVVIAPSLITIGVAARASTTVDGAESNKGLYSPTTQILFSRRTFSVSDPSVPDTFADVDVMGRPSYFERASWTG